MRTSEFKMDGKGRLLWSLPVERSKNKRARVTPILGLALEIITPYLNYAHNNDILFENEAGKPLYSGLIGQQLLQRLDRLPIARFSTHDLRRTVATMMTAKLSLSLDLVAMVVGHTAGGARHKLSSGTTCTTTLRTEKRSGSRNGIGGCAKSWPARPGRWSPCGLNLRQQTGQYAPWLSPGGVREPVQTCRCADVFLYTIHFSSSYNFIIRICTVCTMAKIIIFLGT